MLEVEVRDSGVGIKEEDQKKLFKLFGYLDTTKELNTRGIGLGLYISKLIVQQFGGEIVC
jgi:signal transduction histidine kinase